MTYEYSDALLICCVIVICIIVAAIVAITIYTKED